MGAEVLTITRGQRMRGGTGAHVYEALRAAIVSAELEPGRQLSENELAERLRVSRTPVREAIAGLRDERLVEIVPQLGTFVTRISMSAVGDAQFVRESLECAAVRLAAEAATAEDVAVLEGIVARQAASRDAGDFDGFYDLDDDFHAAISRISGRPIAWALAKRANGQLDRVRRLSLPQPDYLREMVDEHNVVLAAIAKNDPDSAGEQMRRHLQMVLSSVPDVRTEHPDYFDDEEI